MLDFYPHNGYMPTIPLGEGRLIARVLLEAERGRFSCGAAIHRAHGRLGHRPVRRVPDREVLAALVPERVLPFASGDSRKRGLSRAGMKSGDVPRWGAERRARPLHEVPAASVLPQGGKEKGRAPHPVSMRLLHAPIGAPPPFF